MKKFTAFMIIEMFIFILGGCKSATSQSINTKISSSTDAASIYSFPEPTIQVQISFKSFIYPPLL